MCSGCGGGYLCQVLESTSVGLRAVCVVCGFVGVRAELLKRPKSRAFLSLLSQRSLTPTLHRTIPLSPPVAAVPSARRLLPNRRNALNRMSGWSG